MRDFISRTLGAMCLVIMAIAATLAPLAANEGGVRAIITARLANWSDAFNARDVSRTCDLFSADLISTMRGRPDEGRDAVCSRIARALTNHRLRVHYTPHIQEVLVSGDVAMVRLTWSVTTRIGAVTEVSMEPGIDIFRREADGKWRITRFLAYSIASK